MAINFKDRRKQQLGIKSLGERIKEGGINTGMDTSKYVHGPAYMDNLVHKWSRGKVLGLLGPSGGGKTELVLEMFEAFLHNNPGEVCVFVTLENTISEIAERWIARVGNDSELTDRLHVVSNFEDDGKPKMLGTESILYECSQIKNVLGCNITAFAIDHLHVINKKDGESNNKICQKVKDLAVELDSLAILLSQTTKAKGKGDIPLDKDASYDCSQFAWIADQIISVHFPLMRVANETDMNILAWQYAKIRNKHKDDPIKVSINQLLSYNMETRKLRELTTEEIYEFQHLYQKVLELRDLEEKSKFCEYNLGKNVKLNTEELRENEPPKKKENKGHLI